MTVQNRRIFASILFVLISFVCRAYGDEPPPPAIPPPFLPIDGGVIVGAIVAMFFGARKILSQNKKK